MARRSSISDRRSGWGRALFVEDVSPKSSEESETPHPLSPDRLEPDRLVLVIGVEISPWREGLSFRS